ncbi:MAG: methyltransferase domain-containing protein [Actinomycetota bacterium]
MTNAIHPAADAGFGSAAGAYERGRPGYPADAVAHLIRVLGIGPSDTVLDLAAGTGKLTELLVSTGAELVTVEPVDEMRDRLQARIPAIRTLRGTAEAIPLGDASADAVTVAQAFHWFDGELALREIHRVLRPGRGLGLVWNVRDESVDWVARLTDILDPYAGDTPRHRSGVWRAAFDRTDLFGEMKERSFPHAHETTPEGLVDRVLSTSFIAALEESGRDRVQEQVVKLTRRHPELAGRERFGFPYRTDVLWCERT